MAVTIEKPQNVGRRSVLLSWSSDLSEPTFYIYQDGRLVNTTKATSQVFTVETGEALLVEVLDSATERPATAFPGRVTLGWFPTPATRSYRVEELILAAWTLRATIRDLGQGYFNWKSRFLEDVTTHQFRIIPVGDNGNNGTAKTMSFLMVRHPSPPTVSYSYDSGDQTVTISAS